MISKSLATRVRKNLIDSRQTAYVNAGESGRLIDDVIKVFVIQK